MATVSPKHMLPKAPDIEIRVESRVQIPPGVLSWAVSSVVRAPVLHAGGQWFKSTTAHSITSNFSSVCAVPIYFRQGMNRPVNKTDNCLASLRSAGSLAPCADG